MIWKTKLNNQRGISLVEVILVMIIAGVMFLLIANLPSSLSLIGTSRREALAKEIIAKKIEDLRSQTYVNLANGTIQIIDSRLSSLPQSSSQVTIDDCPITICTNGELAKQVKIHLTWIESGKTKTMDIATLIAKNGLQ